MAADLPAANELESWTSNLLPLVPDLDLNMTTLRSGQLPSAAGASASVVPPSSINSSGSVPLPVLLGVTAGATVSGGLDSMRATGTGAGAGAGFSSPGVDGSDSSDAILPPPLLSVTSVLAAGAEAYNPQQQHPQLQQQQQYLQNQQQQQLRMKSQPTFTVSTELMPTAVTRPVRPGQEFTEYSYKPDVGRVIAVSGTAAHARKRKDAPVTEEDKQQKRLESNRESARQSRERKKQYVLELEAYVQSLEAGRSDCEAAVRRLTAENQLLRAMHADLMAELKATRQQLERFVHPQ